ncbi:hypothetical protein [Paenibacillus guangzhouensis]|uniref:hypothetical protein n=1 Tax=Paenibacillus guangzhouensis TaxID=1473112 RepID=UPI00126777DB|nr:hypothetical protein [Paenibacillus guangzhouensis]
MSYRCPLCNGFIAPHVTCPACHQLASDYGKLEDYEGPYSPYADYTTYAELSSMNHNEQGAPVCTHLLYCEACQRSSPLQVIEWGPSLGE